MTAAEVAEHLDGRQIGPGRWIARCPAHADRAPSLRVTEGRDGRVLVHCFAGCSLPVILRSAGILLPQLFPVAAQREPAAAAAQARQRSNQAARRHAERKRIDRLRTLWQEYDHAAGALGYRLAVMPNETPGGAALTACFHQLLAEMRRIDGELMGDDEWA